jgi:hypothetical protein
LMASSATSPKGRGIFPNLAPTSFIGRKDDGIIGLTSLRSLLITQISSPKQGTLHNSSAFPSVVLPDAFHVGVVSRESMGANEPTTLLSQADRAWLRPKPADRGPQSLSIRRPGHRPDPRAEQVGSHGVRFRGHAKTARHRVRFSQ